MFPWKSGVYLTFEQYSRKMRAFLSLFPWFYNHGKYQMIMWDSCSEYYVYEENKDHSMYQGYMGINDPMGVLLLHSFYIPLESVKRGCKLSLLRNQGIGRVIHGHSFSIIETYERIKIWIYKFLISYTVQKSLKSNNHINDVIKTSFF